MPKHHIAGAAALLLATAPAAWAEIDARTLWSDWQEVATRLGSTLGAGEENYAGGTLTLVGVSMEDSLGGASSTTDYGTIEMIEQDDGTVRIELPPSITMTSTTNADDGTVEETADITTEGLGIVVREEDGVRTYDAEFDKAVLLFTPESPEGEEPQDMTVTLTGFTSTYRSGLDGDANAFDATTEGESLTVAVGSGAAGETFSLSDVLTGLSGTMKGNLGDAPTEPVTSLSDLEMTYSGEMSHSGSTLTMAGEGTQGPFSLDWTDEAGTLKIDLAEDTLSYALGGTGSAATAALPGLPVPVTFSMAASTFGLALPSGAGEEAKPFALGLELRELAVDDTLWSLFDPTGQLPRDPATLVVDLEGTAQMIVDLFGDPAAMAELQQPPGELRSLAINRILLSLAGAELRGSGALEFPEGTGTSEPVGAIELALDGGFALADRLVALGFIPQEQAAFVKGMAGAVARSVGDDQLESTIEFTPGGGISANGLPVR